MFGNNLQILVTYYFIFRAMNNAAIIKKVFNNDGKLESLNDKRTSCILLLSGLICLLENIRSKLWTLDDIDLLEEIVSFTRCIYGLIVKFTSQHSTYVIRTCHKKPGVFYPMICQARRMEVFSLLCDMTSMLQEFKKSKFSYMCNKVNILNAFVSLLKLSLHFLEQFLLKNSHFHVVIPPPYPKPMKYVQKYY